MLTKITRIHHYAHTKIGKKKILKIPSAGEERSYWMIYTVLVEV
jgi:hypothetical protein